MDNKCIVGGQAVIEGVMMKNGDNVATAVRAMDGTIKSEKKTVKSLTKRKVLGWPIIRGIIVLGETMSLGIKALNFSAKEAFDEEEEEEESKFSSIYMIIVSILAFGLAILLFKFAPLWIAQFLNSKIALFSNKYAFAFAEGVLKIGILVGYIYTISLMGDVKRTFMYHGAEHKVVNCYENEGEVNVERAKKYSTIHPRCGTSFILLVLFISIVIYVLIPLDMGILPKLGLRLAALPLIAGISYEILKLSAKYRKNMLLKVFTGPGLIMQKMTTREPDEKQLEVAVHALKDVV